MAFLILIRQQGTKYCLPAWTKNTPRPINLKWPLGLDEKYFSFQYKEKFVAKLLQNFQFSWLVDPTRLVSPGNYLGGNTLCRKLGWAEHKYTFSSQGNEEEDATGKTIKDIEEEKKAEKEKQQK